MNVQLITKTLVEDHLNFVNYISNLTQEDYDFSYQNKWSSGQHLDHIIKSVAVLAKALAMPKAVLKYKFGKANRASRNIDEIVSKYLEKLKTAKPTPSRFQPDIVPFKQKEKAINKLNNTVEKLCKRAKKYSETDLDFYILPHPLLGKMIIRELLYFTSYHVKHHQELITKYISITK